MAGTPILSLTVTHTPTGQLDVQVAAVVEQLDAAQILRQIADRWDPPVIRPRTTSTHDQPGIQDR